MKMSSIVKDKAELYYKVFTLMNIAQGDKFNFVNTEKKVMSLLYSKRDELYKTGLTVDEIDVILFSKIIKKEIMDLTNISYAAYHNILAQLRTKKMLVKNTLHPFFPSLRDHDVKNNYEFTLDIKLG